MAKFLLILFVLPLKLLAYDPIPGTIPLDYGHYPATDLVCDNDDCGTGIKKGDILTPEEAEALYYRRSEETKGQWTLGDLNPAESYIWKDEKGSSHNSSDDELKINDLDTVDFISEGWARLGSYRMTVGKGGKQYTLILSKTVHNFLLRKALLRKLGYSVPGIKYLKRVKVEFPSKKEKKDFISSIQINNAGSFDRWVLSEDDKKVVLQDLIIMEDQEFQMNLAKGYISEDIFQGKRIYDSLLIPYALTEIPESINMLDWTVGRIYSTNVYLKFPYAKDYDCSHGDALWMVRRILKLTLEDFEEIVREGNLPPTVSALLLEKMKSRRNHLAILFNIDAVEFPVNSTITNGEDLVDGKLQKEFFEGYARRFKIPDPESPLSFSEMSSFFKSKALSTSIDLLISAFNNSKFMGTDISKKVEEFNEKILAEAVANNIVTGNSGKLPVKTFAFPTVGGDLIVNREIVAGSYLGTDNLIQLVDTVGASVNAGVFGGMTGVYTKTGKQFIANGEVARQFVPVNLTLNSKLYYNRTYSHVKPIQSVKKALKYPFKNMFVPLLKRKYGRALDKIKDLDEETKDEEINEMLGVLSDNLEVGESIIITDTVGGNLTTGVGLSLYNVAKVNFDVKPNKYMTSRLHLFRANEDEIHIYKDLGNVNGIELMTTVKAYVPVLKIKVKGTFGKGKTKFYKVNIAKNKNNVGREDSLRALRAVFFSGSLKSLDKVQKPFVVTHKYDEASMKLGIFVFRWDKLNTSDKISVSSPSGDKKNFYRRNKGETVGIDYEGYVKDLIQVLTAKLLKTNANIMSIGEGNPGYTFMGKAKNRISTYEVDLDSNQKERSMVKLSRIWNGWKVKAEKAKKILKDIKDRYGFRFFEDNILSQTKNLFLYNINVKFFVYEKGLSHVLNLSDDEIKEIWKKNQTRDLHSFKEEKDSLVLSGINNFLKRRQKYHKALLSQDEKKMSKHLLRMVEIVESKISVPGMEKLFGGKENFFVVSKIEGFRVGDENGDESLTSSTFGEIGNHNLSGPIDSVRQFMDMSSGEFYMSWLLGRVI